MRRTLIAALSILYLSSLYGQDFEFYNRTNYQLEALTHTAPVQESHIIGWLLNSSTLKYGSHSLNVGLMITHGGTPSSNLVGDLQTFSNLEAGFLYGFYEAYYQYQRNDLWIKLGQVDINSDFMVSDNGLLFAHSSFGIDPAMTINLPAPTYPVTGASITAQIPVTDEIRIRIGLFDGQFDMPNNEYLGVNWNLSREEGLLNIFETEIKLLKDKITQKVGFYHHTGQFYNYENQLPSKGLSAFYSITDWQIEQKGNSNTNLFFQFDKSNKANSSILFYYGIGLRSQNKISWLVNDEIGLAYGFAKVNPIDEAIIQNYNLRREGIIEASVKFEINRILASHIFNGF